MEAKIETPGFDYLPDPHPASEKFSNLKLYNHLIKHMKTYEHADSRRYCSIECMTREFEPQLTKPGRKKSRQRLSPFQRWARETQAKFVVVPKAGGNSHGKAIAAKLFDPLTADAHEREQVAADVNRALRRREISEETYNKIFELVYPLLENGTSPPDESK